MATFAIWMFFIALYLVLGAVTVALVVEGPGDSPKEIDFSDEAVVGVGVLWPIIWVLAVFVFLPNKLTRRVIRRARESKKKTKVPKAKAREC